MKIYKYKGKIYHSLWELRHEIKNFIFSDDPTDTVQIDLDISIKNKPDSINQLLLLTENQFLQEAKETA